MPLRLFDSLSREVRELKPGHPDGVFRFYNCGPTVYAPAHIGNFRTFLINDVIRRILELEFGPGSVRHVRNLTDVDDKTIKQSRADGRPLAEVTRRWTDKFHDDCRALNCLPPHEEPRAADPAFLRAQVDMIEVLMRKGHAYRAADGSVYFKVSSFPAYGRLSRLNERELQPGAALRSADSDEKEDGSDFALWKAWKEDDGPVKWPGPEGAAAGRPGWHIECSAMNRSLLGETIDLHTGGVDLLFPHHENEIAQSECCSGKPFVRHWYHSEHLLVDGRKMSKSLGNLYTLEDLTGRGFTPMAVRYALLAGHPRKQLNFTLESLHAAESALEKLRRTARQLLSSAARAEAEFAEVHRQPAAGREGSVFGPSYGALCDDLNVPMALGSLFDASARAESAPGKESSRCGETELGALSRLMFALGIDLFRPAGAVEIPAEITSLAEKRWTAKRAKDFAAADALRQELAAAGWSMLDGREGYKLERVRP